MYKIEIFLKKIYGNRFAGEFGSSLKGEGYDLEDFKEYETQDNVKKINRKMSAKYDKEYVSVYKVEKDPVLDIFLDLSQNYNFFQEKLENYLSLLNLLLNRFGIRKNIYVFTSGKINKVDDLFPKLKQKKSCINEILSSEEFKNKKNYKILISDFSFAEVDKLDNLLTFKNKSFSIILSFLDVLKKSKFSLLNGFFDSRFNKDFINKYSDILDYVKKYSLDFEEL